MAIAPQECKHQQSITIGNLNWKHDDKVTCEIQCDECAAKGEWIFYREEENWLDE